MPCLQEARGSGRIQVPLWKRFLLAAQVFRPTWLLLRLQSSRKRCHSQSKSSCQGRQGGKDLICLKVHWNTFWIKVYHSRGYTGIDFEGSRQANLKGKLGSGFVLMLQWNPHVSMITCLLCLIVILGLELAFLKCCVRLKKQVRSFGTFLCQICVETNLLSSIRHVQCTLLINQPLFVCPSRHFFQMWTLSVACEVI